MIKIIIYFTFFSVISCTDNTVKGYAEGELASFISRHNIKPLKTKLLNVEQDIRQEKYSALFKIDFSDNKECSDFMNILTNSEMVYPHKVISNSSHIKHIGDRVVIDMKITVESIEIEQSVEISDVFLDDITSLDVEQELVFFVTHDYAKKTFGNNCIRSLFLKQKKALYCYGSFSKKLK